MEQQGEALAWVGPVVEDALGAGSPILRSFQASEAPAFYAVAVAALIGHRPDHPDREILFMAEVFLAVADLLLRTDPETSERDEIPNACGEWGPRGAWPVWGAGRTAWRCRTPAHGGARPVLSPRPPRGEACACCPSRRSPRSA